jgi:glycerol-3-phosphate dehydrogenase
VDPADARARTCFVRRERLPTDGAVIFTSPVDGRVMFLIPWPRFTAIGTTDIDASPTEPVRATRDEVRYLLDSANGLVPGAGLAESGRRLDVGRPAAAARLERGRAVGALSARSARNARAPCTRSAGGKLTGFRSMAERLGAAPCERSRHGLVRRGTHRRERCACAGAFETPVARPEWSRLESTGAPRDPRDAVLVAWTRRLRGAAPARGGVLRSRRGGPLAARRGDAPGEVDWAVRHEDCLSAADFFLRRTDLGYGARAEVEALAPRVLARLAENLSWASERQTRGAVEVGGRALARLHAWRDAPSRAHGPSSSALQALVIAGVYRARARRPPRRQRGRRKVLLGNGLGKP